MKIDVVYESEHISKKPDWFNGFIEVQRHTKKYDWSKYVVLDSYYHENGNPEIQDRKKRNKHVANLNPKFGYIEPRMNNISEDHKKTMLGEQILLHSDSKQGLVSRSLCALRCYDITSISYKNKRYFYSNGEYVIRQNMLSETDLIIHLIRKAKAENPSTFASESYLEPIIKKNHFVVVANKSGDLVGAQSFQIGKNHIKAEPFTYISEEARGQGIFSIFHEFTLTAADSIDAEYIYSRCRVDNQIMKAAYEKYGYIRQSDLKIIQKREYYEFKYPLQTEQTSFF